MNVNDQNESKILACVFGLVLTIGVMWYVTSNPAPWEDKPTWENKTTTVKAKESKSVGEVTKSWKYKSSVEMSYTERE